MQTNIFDTKVNPNLIVALGIYIRSKRINKKIGLREMSEMLNISPAYLSNLESGKHNMMNPLLIKNISKILEIDHLTLFKMIGYTDKDKKEIRDEIINELIGEINNDNISNIIREILKMNDNQLSLLNNYVKIIKKT